MIETNIQNQQHDGVTLQPPLMESGPALETGLTVMCGICAAIYSPSPLQLPFLQYTQGALEATFMGMCHFCFRCRRAACPQCWDDVHGVCGSCVQEAKLPFRAETVPLDGLMFPPPLRQPLTPHQSQIASLFIPVHPGRFSSETRIKTNQATPGIDTDPVFQPVGVQIVAPDSLVTESEKSNIAVTVAAPPKTPLPEVLKDTSKQKNTPHVTKKKVSRLELVFTWIVLVIVLVLVVVIALAEYIPAVNALVLRVINIDIHEEIAYLVHIVQQLFKK